MITKIDVFFQRKDYKFIITLNENIDGSTLDNSDYSYDEVKKM